MVVAATEASVDTLDPGGDEEQRRRGRWGWRGGRRGRRRCWLRQRRRYRNRRGRRYRPGRRPLGVPTVRGRPRASRRWPGERTIGQHWPRLEAQAERWLPARQTEGPVREAETHQRLRARHGHVRHHRDGHRERTVQRRCLHQGESDPRPLLLVVSRLLSVVLWEFRKIFSLSVHSRVVADDCFVYRLLKRRCRRTRDGRCLISTRTQRGVKVDGPCA